MNELKHEKKVKTMGVDDDVLCIELFSGLRLMGPVKTRPVPRQPEPAKESAELARPFADPVVTN